MLQNPKLWAHTQSLKQKIPHHDTSFHAQNYLQYYIKLYSDHVYSVWNKWLCLDLGLILQISYNTWIYMQVSQNKDENPFHFWPQACKITANQSTAASFKAARLIFLWNALDWHSGCWDCRSSALDHLTIAYFDDPSVLLLFYCYCYKIP